MPEYDAGTAALSIFPSFKGVQAAVKKEAQKWGLDAGKAFADSFNQAVKRETGKTPLGPDKPTSTKGGDTAGGAFADGFKKRVQAALKTLPDVKIGADSSDVDVKLAAIRAELEELSRQRIGIDVDESVALAQLDRLRGELTQLSAESGSIQVRADTAAAVAELDKLKADVDKVAASSPTVDVDAKTAAADAALAATKTEADNVGRSRPTINVGADVTGALAGIASVHTALIGLGVAVGLPAIAGLASIGGPLIAAGVGLAGMAAVAVPAITNIKKALDAQKKSADAVKTADTELQNANDQVASAQQGLTDAQRSADQQSIASAEQVRNARQSLADAEKQQARDRQSSAEAVAAAQQQAAQQESAAVAQVKTAEQNLAQAQQSAQNAQEALTQARKDAADQLKQLAFQTSDAALAQRQDELNVEQARQQLAAVNKNRSATALQRQEAKLNYDQAVQALKEQKYATQQLAQQKADADKKGVKGSDQVKQAQQNLANANQDVADKQQALLDAQRNVVQTQIDGARTIADAQRKAAQQQADDAESVRKAQQGVTDALREQANQQANSAASIQRASATLGKALRAQHKAQTDVATATGASKAAMDQLTPSEQRAASAFGRAKKAFGDWYKGLEPSVLPAFSGGLDLITRALNPFSPAISGAAGAVTDLEKKAGKAFGGPFWKNFSKFIGKESRTAVGDLGTAFGNVATGLAGLFEFLAPLGNFVLSSLDTITGDFSSWGQNLAKSKPSPATQKAWHNIGQAFGDLAQAIGGLVIAVGQDLVPIAGPLIDVIANLAKGASGALEFVKPLFDLMGRHPRLFSDVATGLVAVAGGLYLLNAAADAGPIGIALLAVGMLILGIVELVKHFDTVKRELIKWGPAVLGPLLPIIGIPLLIVRYWRPLTGFFKRIGNDVISPFRGVPGWFAKLPGRLYGALKDTGTKIASPFVSAYRYAQPRITHGLDTITGWFAHLPGRLFSALKQTGSQIASPFVNAYRYAKPYVTGGLTTIVTWFVHLPGRIRNGLSTLGSEIWSGFKAAYHWSKDHITGGIDTIVGWFTRLPDHIGNALSSLGDKIAKPFEDAFGWIAKHVINPFMNAITKVIPGVQHWTIPTDYTGNKHNDIGKASGLGHVGGIPGHAGGGLIRSPLAWVGEQGPELAEKLPGGDVRIHSTPTSRRIAAALGVPVPGMSIGGLLSDVGHGFTSTARKATHIARDITGSVVGQAIRAAEKAGDLTIGQMPFGKNFKTIAHGVLSKIADAVEDWIKGGGAGQTTSGKIKVPAGSAVGRWAGVVGQVLKALKQPLSLTNAVLSLIGFESAGNPKAVNTYDINWIEGHPSVGLAQVIRGTFQRYAGKYRNRGPFAYGVSEDPFANIYAGLNYGIGRYGAIANIPGIQSVLHGGPYKPYDSGLFSGPLPPGITLAYNGRGENEYVVTKQQLAALRNGQHAATAAVAHQPMRQTIVVEMDGRVLAKAQANAGAREVRLQVGRR